MRSLDDYAALTEDTIGAPDIRPLLLEYLLWVEEGSLRSNFSR
jgi:hypothetical protein